MEIIIYIWKLLLTWKLLFTCGNYDLHGSRRKNVIRFSANRFRLRVGGLV
jgi:hypothetical protein